MNIIISILVIIYVKGEKMTELSNLLKSAKPLYFEQKRKQQRIRRTCLSLFMVITVFASGYGGYAIKSLSTDSIATTENYTTDSYFPVDDYGLITVAY